MSKLIVSAQVREQLNQAKEPVEVFDESGKFLGKFLPPWDPSRVKFIVPPNSDEELERRFASGGPYVTLDEALARAKARIE